MKLVIRRPPKFSKGPYSSSSKSHSRGSSSQKKSSSGSGSGTSSFRGPIKYFRCGGPHMLRDCPHPRTNCGNCGKLGHTANVCWSPKKSGSTSSAQRPKSRGSTGPSTGPKPSISGRVFAMSRAEASQSEELI
ncbi:ATP-dependent RNA helicase glh-1-like [Abrus precatorius]|uniref:ATP-dependent RNA helicase glh-1-like n=1 Tax=Abrus precatorius TaxID=3816 RepID=A0A8B8LPX0_ABRPR|nr:ATP-dependent RNA helicase glh-1-like [Abrus precatorius]